VIALVRYWLLELLLRLQNIFACFIYIFSVKLNANEPAPKRHRGNSCGSPAAEWIKD
jgi:hypothetical protein